MKPKRLDSPPQSCVECGFLGTGDPDDEVSKETRYLIELWEIGSLSMEYAAGLRCHKRMWLDYNLHYSGNSIEGVEAELKISRADCAGFFIHSPGYTPKEHLARQEQERREQFQLRLAKLGTKGALIAGVVGGTAVKILDWLPVLIRWVTTRF